jgi:adenylate kinase
MRDEKLIRKPDRESLSVFHPSSLILHPSAERFAFVQRLIMLGPPGSGKGTQGVKLAERFGVPHVASGDLLRRILASGEESELARAVKAIDEGIFVSDEIASAVVFRELDKAAGFVLDGYPRNVRQAELLDAYLHRRELPLFCALYLSVAEEELLKRLAGRLTCENCGETFHITLEPPRVAGICDNCGAALTMREDDRPDRIRVRLQIYAERTRPVLDYYRDDGRLRRVDGVGMQDAVFARCLQEVAEASQK